MVSGELAKRIEKYLREIAPDLYERFLIIEDQNMASPHVIQFNDLEVTIEIRLKREDKAWRGKLRAFVEKCRSESG